MSGNTRNRILVASLLLFNERGVAGTSLNEIADEVDISPGNLHYHFRRKSQLVSALLAEFKVDARSVLAAPDDDAGIDDFWVFVHLLVELIAAYRFLFRDLESLAGDYADVRSVLSRFGNGIRAIFELYLLRLAADGELAIDEADMPGLARNLMTLVLFSERLEQLSGEETNADAVARKAAASALIALRPFATATSAPHFDALASRYLR